MAQKYLKLIKVARNLGFEIADEFMIGPWCAARHPNTWMIGPQGELYKCTCDLGRIERVSGMITEPTEPSDDSSVLNLAKQRLDDCLSSDCELVPVCGGGCLFDFRVKPEIACRKDFLLAVNKGLMLFQAS
jgi:radical SAM protein with 4Fe4S-binding SPASM domain